MAANLLKHKRSAVPNKAPGVGDLSLGELAINTYDGDVYLKRNGASGEEIVKLSGSVSIIASDTRVIVDEFTGDGTTTDFTLSIVPETENFSFVTINGVDQHTSSYSVSAATLTFSEAPENGDAIEVRTLNVNQADVALRDYKSYVYQPTTSTTTFSGVDENGATLEYDIEKIEVYLNGIRLVNGFDYTAINGTSVILESSIGSGDTLEVVSLSKASFLENNSIEKNFAITDTDQVLDRFLKDNYRTVKYIVQALHGTDVHSTEVLLTHNGTDVFLTEYATIFSTNSLITLSADIDNTYVDLVVTPTNTNTNVKFIKNPIAI